MASVKVRLDEDVHGAIADALRLRGYEVLMPAKAGSLGATDDEQLELASASGHAVLTYNVGDFARLHSQWLAQGRTHSGLILARQSDGLGNIRPLLRLLSQISAEQLRGQVVYLTNWR